MPRTTTAVLAVLPLLLTACAGSGSSKDDAPLTAINDLKAHTDTRTRAINRLNEAVAAGEVDAASARESLKRVAWSRATFWKVRAAAIDELVEDEKNLADTKNMLRLMLPTEPASEIVRKITDMAAAGKWPELSTAIVRRWSKVDSRVTDDKRPERAALAAIFPDRPVEDTVFAAFANTIEGVPSDERARQDAWALLRRIDKSGRTRDLLAGGGAGEGTDEMMSTLRRGASELRCVPESAEQLAWMQRLGTKDGAAFWQQCAAAVSRLNDDQSRGFAMRHLGVLRWAAENRADWLGLDRASLLSELERRLEGRPRHWRVGEGSAGNRGESLHRFREELVWGDALAALVADDLLSSGAANAALFDCAQRDQKDTSTEYGGNIDAVGTTPRVDLFPPRATQRYNDRQFVPSEEMLKAGDTALFHFHFHATTWNNADYAGPSDGDLQTANTLGRASLLFTSIDDRTLAVDYYQAGGAVIDLGELKKAK
jgi:hypothetical protein